MRSANDCEALDLHGVEEDDAVSGCFEFRLRTRSFDLHQTPANNKLTKLTNLLRSRSDGIVRSSSQPLPIVDTSMESPRTSQRASLRRRFIRVVRDQPAIDPDNPHIIHKYSSNFLQKQNLINKSSSSNEYQSLPPYTITGHTILKKQGSISSSGVQGGSLDQVLPEPPLMMMVAKHTSFRDEVEVMEYDKKEKIRRGPLLKRRVKLYDYTDAELLGSRDEEDSEGNSGVDSLAGNFKEESRNEKNKTKSSVMEAITSELSSFSTSDKTSNTHAYIFSPTHQKSQEMKNRLDFNMPEVSASAMGEISREEYLGMSLYSGVRCVDNSNVPSNKTTDDEKIVKSLTALDVKCEKRFQGDRPTSKQFYS